MIAAVFTEIKFMDLSDGERRIIQALSEANDQNELFLRTEATAGIVFATAGIAFLIGAIAMIGRICNARHEKTTYRVFSCLVSCREETGGLILLEANVNTLCFIAVFALHFVLFLGICGCWCSWCLHSHGLV